MEAQSSALGAVVGATQPEAIRFWIARHLLTAVGCSRCSADDVVKPLTTFGMGAVVNSSGHPLPLKSSDDPL